MNINQAGAILGIGTLVAVICGVWVWAIHPFSAEIGLAFEITCLITGGSGFMAACYPRDI